MSTTRRLALATASATTVKALVFGAAASLALVLGMAQAAQGLEPGVEIVTLEPVVITVKKEQLPTVYVTGRRATSSN